MIFLVYHCPSHFLSIQTFSKLDSRSFQVFEKVGGIIWGSEKIAIDISIPVPIVKEFPPARDLLKIFVFRIMFWIANDVCDSVNKKIV